MEQRAVRRFVPMWMAFQIKHRKPELSLEVSRVVSKSHHHPRGNLKHAYPTLARQPLFCGQTRTMHNRSLCLLQLLPCLESESALGMLEHHFRTVTVNFKQSPFFSNTDRCPSASANGWQPAVILDYGEHHLHTEALRAKKRQALWAEYNSSPRNEENDVGP